MKAAHRLPPWLGYVGLSFAWLVVMAVVVFLGRRPAMQPIEIIPPPTLAPSLTQSSSETPIVLPTVTPGPLYVDVAGAVRHPAVYRLAPGSRVADAIAAAGGPTDDADLDLINKAVLLDDSMQVYVPRRAAPEGSGPTAAAAPPPISTAPVRPAGGAASGGAPASLMSGAARPTLVNLNTASLAELDTLPGVGEVTAQKIIAARPFARIEDLLRVDGIGEAKLAQLKDLVTVD